MVPQEQLNLNCKEGKKQEIDEREAISEANVIENVSDSYTTGLNSQIELNNNPDIVANDVTIQNDDKICSQCIKTFHVDYSIKGTAKCRVCKKVIQKNELRIGKYVPFKQLNILHYFHVNCAFQHFRKARTTSNIIRNLMDLSGLDDLTDNDKTRIKELISYENLVRKHLPETTCTKKNTGTHPDKSQVQTRQLKLTSIKENSLKVLYTNADQLTASKMTELRKRIQHHKPSIVAICEVKPKNSTECNDLQIPGYSLYPVNLDSQTGRDIAVYSHKLVEKSIIHIKPSIAYDEICL